LRISIRNQRSFFQDIYIFIASKELNWRFDISFRQDNSCFFIVKNWISYLDIRSWWKPLPNNLDRKHFYLTVWCLRYFFVIFISLIFLDINKAWVWFDKFFPEQFFHFRPIINDSLIAKISIEMIFIGTSDDSNIWMWASLSMANFILLD